MFRIYRRALTIIFTVFPVVLLTTALRSLA